MSRSFFVPSAIILAFATVPTTTAETPTKAPTDPPTEAATDDNNPFANPDIQNGPWPECMGWQGEDCANYIKGVVDDTVSAEVLDEIIPDIHRVVVRVDDNNVVMTMPIRG